MRVRCNDHRRSFTLLEVLIALGLSIALLGTVFSFYFNMLNTRARLLAGADQFRAATTLIDRLEADLLVCIAGSESLGEGVRGGNESITIASRSVAASLAERGALDPAVYSDLQITQYAFDQAAQRIELTRWAANNDRTKTTETLTERIASVRFRYYDGTRWNDQFDSIDADALPHAVEIAIWFEGDETEETAPPSTPDGNEPARETFDSAGGFDEFDFAMRDDRGFEDEALPDRWRIIRIPDAAPVNEPVDESPLPGAGLPGAGATP